MSEYGHRVVAGEGLKDMDGISQVGVEGVEVSVVAVAVSSVIPGDDSPSSISEKGSEHIEGPREVRPPVYEHENRIRWVSPFVHRDADTISVNTVMSIWGAGAGERPDRVHVMRLGRRTVES